MLPSTPLSEGASCGCRAAGRGEAPWWVLLSLCALVLRRRR
ncbi:MAG: MYXO-CTERM sorting domain-containing protein [Sandaracinaceae bacterium]